MNFVTVNAYKSSDDRTIQDYVATQQCADIGVSVGILSILAGIVLLQNDGSGGSIQRIASSIGGSMLAVGAGICLVSVCANNYQLAFSGLSRIVDIHRRTETPAASFSNGNTLTVPFGGDDVRGFEDSDLRLRPNNALQRTGR